MGKGLTRKRITLLGQRQGRKEIKTTSELAQLLPYRSLVYEVQLEIVSPFSSPGISAMSSLMNITQLLLAAGLIVSFYVIFIYQKHKDLAPGPWALPYFGNAFQVPTEKSWVYFYNICKIFGEFLSLDDLYPAVI